MREHRVAVSTLMVLAAVGASSGAQVGDASAYPSAEGMVGAARALLGEISAQHQGWSQSGFTDPDRFNFQYTPASRSGLPLGQLQVSQQELVWGLVDSGLGERGRRQARDIVRLERYLYEASDLDAMRDPGMYLIAFFGVSGANGRWGWRFEGHHLSLNFTVLDGRVVGTTPAFFGGSPATLERERTRPALRPFAREEDEGRALLASLDTSLRGLAVYSTAAPRDVLTSNHALAARPPALGVRYGALPPEQQRMLLDLLGLYAARLEPELAEFELAQIRAAGLDELRFAWAGGMQRGEPHYYRIQGPTFVVEYDNTQNDANHVHTVWRNFERDFGRDPLREHLAAAHHSTDHQH